MLYIIKKGEMMNESALESMKKELSRRMYSPRTIESYCYCVNQFFKCCSKDVKKLSKKDVREFMEGVMDKSYAGNTVNVYFNSIKFLVEEILRKKWMLKINYCKTPKEKPVFLTKEETAGLLNSIENRKHKLMASLMYSAGLRVSELVNLKVKDIEFGNNCGWVRHGKGNKNRLFILSEKLRCRLKEWILENELNEYSWLFKGNNDSHMSIRTVQEIVKKAAEKAGIKKNVHPHTLRHSFATHLVRDGNDLLSVQSLLGHTSAATTMLYVHMASPTMLSVRSPLDSLA